MLQKLASIFLLLGILLPNLLKGYILVDYALNQDYIAKYLCVNREVPESKCNGKCYLSTILKKAEKSTADDQIPSSLVNLPDTLVFLCKAGIVYQLFPPATEKVLGKNFVSLNPLTPGDRLFRPPRFVHLT